MRTTKPYPSSQIDRNADKLVLRARPGARKKAEPARQRGQVGVKPPLVPIRPGAWEPPAPETVEAVMLTSAKAARSGGKALAMFSHLPCYAVGETTAEAARAAGFADIRDRKSVV